MRRRENETPEEAGRELLLPEQPAVYGRMDPDAWKGNIFGIPEEPVQSEEDTGRGEPIGSEEVLKALQTLKDYQQGKKNLDERIKDNERWFKLHNAMQAVGSDSALELQRRNGENQIPDSAWLFNSLLNKHADAMDNIPEINVLPRAKDDVETAKTLREVLPVVLEQNHFEKVWDESWWYKLKHGFNVLGVFWNGEKLGGLGDVDIQPVDVLNMAWEPGVTDIQASRNLFNIVLMNREEAQQRWPHLNITADNGMLTEKYLYDESIDTSDKVSVVDWYYKKNGSVHYCKFVNDQVIYASENDPEYCEKGYYDHGKYPFVVDNMFPVAGCPVGFGYIDLEKGTQASIDSLRNAIVRNANQAAHRRWFINGSGSINMQEYADQNRDFVTVDGSLGEDSLREIKVDPLPTVYLSVLSMLIDEMKETSGNRDFSQGGTSSGITAASAIAALQEAGSKTSRDMLKSAYRSFSDMCGMIIELMRQFYTAPRYFRVTERNGMSDSFVQFSNSALQMQPYGNDFGVNMGYRKPEFDLKISASKRSTFSQLSQNELMKELYQLGVFKPENADQAMALLQGMTFEGKERVEETVRSNGTLLQQVQQLQDTCMKLAVVADANGGGGITQNMAASFGKQQGSGAVPQVKSIASSTSTNGLGETVMGSDMATKARRNAMNMSSPEGTR